MSVASAFRIPRRLSASATTRPLLSGDKKGQIAGILEARQPLYDAIDHQIDGDQLDPEERAQAILSLYALET